MYYIHRIKWLSLKGSEEGECCLLWQCVHIPLCSIVRNKHTRHTASNLTVGLLNQEALEQCFLSGILDIPNVMLSSATCSECMTQGNKQKMSVIQRSKLQRNRPRSSYRQSVRIMSISTIHLPCAICVNWNYLITPNPQLYPHSQKKNMWNILKGDTCILLLLNTLNDSDIQNKILHW